MSFVGKVNVYTCRTCGGETVTIDLDEGVTPFMLSCLATKGCKGFGQSAMYRPHPGHGEPAWEWYRPDAKELATAHPGMREHAQRGGLFIRARKEPAR